MLLTVKGNVGRYGIADTGLDILFTVKSVVGNNVGYVSQLFG